MPSWSVTVFGEASRQQHSECDRRFGVIEKKQKTSLLCSAASIDHHVSDNEIISIHTASFKRDNGGQ